MNNGQVILPLDTVPFLDWRSVFTKPSYVSCLNYVGALCSEMRSFSVLGFTDLFNLAYDKHDYFISRAVWDERELNRRRVTADLQGVFRDTASPSNAMAQLVLMAPSVPLLSNPAAIQESHALSNRLALAPEETPSNRVEKGLAPIASPGVEKKRVHLILDDSGIRKFTNDPYFVSPQYIGNLGKVDRCLSSVFTVFADTQGKTVIPFEVDPYVPAKKLAAGKNDGEFRSKLEIAASQINRAFCLAQEVGVEIGYTLFDTWYTSGKLLNQLHQGGAQYFGQIRPNRNLKQHGKKISLSRLVTASGPDPFTVHYQEKDYEVWSFVGELAEVDHPVKVFRVKGPFAGQPDIRYYVSDDLNLTETDAVALLRLRWKIDYFFRESKAYLALDEGKFQKGRCYLRHFYLTFLAWSALRLAIRLKLIPARTIFQAVRFIRKRR